MDNSIKDLTNTFSTSQLLAYFKFEVIELSNSFQILSNGDFEIALIRPQGMDNNMIVDLSALKEISKADLFLLCTSAAKHSGLLSEAQAIQEEQPLDLPPISLNSALDSFLSSYLQWHIPENLPNPFNSQPFKGKIFTNRESLIFPLFGTNELTNFLIWSQNSLDFYNNRREAAFQSAFNNQSLALIASNPASLSSFLLIQNPDEFLSLLIHPESSLMFLSKLFDTLLQKNISRYYISISGGTKSDSQLFATIVTLVSATSNTSFLLSSITNSNEPIFLLTPMKEAKLKDAFSFINMLDNELDSHFHDTDSHLLKDATFQKGFRLNYERLKGPQPTLILKLPRNPQVWITFFQILLPSLNNSFNLSFC